MVTAFTAVDHVVSCYFDVVIADWNDVWSNWDKLDALLLFAKKWQFFDKYISYLTFLDSFFQNFVLEWSGKSSGIAGQVNVEIVSGSGKQ